MNAKSETKTPSPKLEKTRATILDVALKVFAKEGFRNTDVQVIADRAKVGKGTVYRHFGNKEQLFLETSKHCMERLGTYLRESIGDEEQVAGVSAQDLMNRIATHYAEFYKKNPLCVEIMIQERAEFRESVAPSHLVFRAETRSEFESFLQQSIDNGELRTLDVQRTTDAFADLLYGSVVNGCLEGPDTDLIARVQYAADIFIRGLLNVKT